MKTLSGVALIVFFHASKATKEGLGMDWYVSHQGQRRGPYSEAQIHGLLREGDLAPHHLAWRFGLVGWTPLFKIAQFQSSKPATNKCQQYKHTRGVQILDRCFNSKPDEPERGSCYFARHWRGQLPLPVSFWINSQLTTLTLVVLVIVMASTGIVDRAPRWFSAGGVAFWTLLTLMTPWQLVGVWRSAGNHLARGQSKLWGRLAQAMVIFGVFASTFSLAYVGLPQSMEFAKLALGRDPVGSYQLQLLRHATELEISGAIIFGMTDDVAKMLDANPKVKIIHLNSHGGRVREARRLRELISSRNLTTFTSAGCFSACTLAYAAGKRRLISKNASLGFHQYAFPGMHQSAFRHQHQKDKKDWLARGFDRAFVERAYATPPDDLWRPPHHELLAARFVTGYPDSNEVAMSGGQYEQFAKLESELSKNALFTALREHEPAVYRRVMAELEAGVRDGRDQAEMRKILQPIAQTVYRKNLARASDIGLLAFTDLFIEQTQALYDTDPDLCYQYVYAPRQNAAADFHRHFSPELHEKEISVMAEVIRSAARPATRPPRQYQVQHQLEEIFTALTRRHGAAVTLLTKPARGESRAAEMCVLTLDLYRAIRGLPENDSAMVLRSMFANGT